MALSSDSFDKAFEKYPFHLKVLSSLEYFISEYFPYLSHPNLGKKIFFTLSYLKFLALRCKFLHCPH